MSVGVRSQYDYYDVNNTTLSGRVVDVPNTPVRGGKQICEFTLAYQKGDKACYIQIVVVDERLAQFCSRSVQKGSYVLVYGFLNEAYIVENEEEYSETNIIANKIQFIPPLGQTSREVYSAVEDYNN